MVWWLVTINLFPDAMVSRYVRTGTTGVCTCGALRVKGLINESE